MMRGYFDYSCRLVRFILRRERIVSTVWFAILFFISAVVPIVLGSQFGTESDLRFFMETMQNPAMIAITGPVYGTDNYSVGAMYANEMLLFTIITIAIMNIFFVVRHTRGDEERGRAEVVRSLPVGRLSNLNSTMLTALILNVALAVLCGLIMFSVGIESMDFAGSMLFGAALGVSGMLFAAVTALFSQLCSTSRSATGYSLMFLGISYLVRAIGDINSEVLSLISPLGLILRTQVYVENYWQPILIILLLMVIVAWAAYYLNSIRDMDHGFIPVKPGRKKASAALRSPYGLAFRLLRNTMLAWTVGMLVFGASYGSIMGEIEIFIAENEFFRMMLPPSPDYSTSELFITMLNTLLSLTCSVPVFIAIFKLRHEEKDNRTEHILGRSISRTKYLSGYVAISFMASLIMPFAAVVGLWSSSVPNMAVPVAFSAMLKAMMVYVPAIWVMLGIAVFLIGILPEAITVCWAYFGFTFFTAYIGRALKIPEIVIKLSPFGHIPQLPVDELNYLTLAVLTVIAAALASAGFIFYRKRDIRA